MGRTARSPHGFTRREALRVLSATSMALPAGVPPARPPLGELGSHHSPLRRGSGRIPSSLGRHKRHRVGADRLRQSGFLQTLQGASEIRQRGLGKFCNRATRPFILREERSFAEGWDLRHSLGTRRGGVKPMPTQAEKADAFRGPGAGNARAGYGCVRKRSGAPGRSAPISG